MTEHEWLVCEDPQRMLRLRRTGCCGAFWIEHEHGPYSVAVGCRSCDLSALGPVELRPIFSDRQLRLFACACVRQVWHLLTKDCSRHAVEVAERLADGKETTKEVDRAREASRMAACTDPQCATCMATECLNAQPWLTFSRNDWATVHAPSAVQCALLREIVGNPYRPLPTEPILPVVARMAQVIYDDRDWDAPPVLADYLEDAGYPDGGLLRHLRGFEKPCPQCLGTGKVEIPRGEPSQGTDEWPCRDCEGVGRMPLRGSHVRGCWALDHVRGVK